MNIYSLSKVWNHLQDLLEFLCVGQHWPELLIELSYQTDPYKAFEHEKRIRSDIGDKNNHAEWNCNCNKNVASKQLQDRNRHSE